MGRFSRFLRFCAILIVSFFTVDAFGAGYTCPALKKYTSCKPGYYLSLSVDGSNSCMSCPAGYYCAGGLQNKFDCDTGTAISSDGVWTSLAGAKSRSECYTSVTMRKLSNGVTGNGTLSMVNPVDGVTRTATGTSNLTVQCYYGISCKLPTVTQKSSTSVTTNNALYNPYVRYTGGWVTSASDSTGGTTTEFTFDDNNTTRILFPAHTSAPIAVTLSPQKNGDTSGIAGTVTIYSKYGTGIYLDSAATSYLMSSSQNPITVPTRAGYVFNGYYTATNAGGTQMINASGYYIGSGSTITGNVTWYAHWLPCAAGYYCPAGSTSTTAYDCDTGTTTPNTNNLWSSAAAASSRNQCFRNVTLNWGSATGATLTWVDGCGNSHTWTPSSSSQSVDVCCKYQVGCVFPDTSGLSRDQFKVLGGWYTFIPVPNSNRVSGAITNIKYVTSTSSNAVYYPAMRRPITITLNRQGGSSSGTTAIYSVFGDAVYLDSGMTQTMTETTNPITRPQRGGYVFSGYYTEESCGGTERIDAEGKITSDFSSTYSSNVTLYACWTPCSAGYYCPAGSTSVTENPCPENWTSDAGAFGISRCYRDIILDSNGMTWRDLGTVGQRTYIVYYNTEVSFIPSAVLVQDGFTATGYWSTTKPNPQGAYDTTPQYTDDEFLYVSTDEEPLTFYALKEGVEVQALILPDIFDGSEVVVTCGQFSGKCILPTFAQTGWAQLTGVKLAGWQLAYSGGFDISDYSGRVFAPGEDVSTLALVTEPYTMEFVPVTQDTSCAAGYYAAGASCKPCEPGYWCYNNSKNVCPLGMTSDSLCSAQNNCYYRVTAGNYWNNDNKMILPCPPGYYCSGNYKVSY
ncbi:MAG: InlB B-repeat-containing protein, partial [Alphaproteobacteria bacterium]|nr:InlB B-repeat-containing protein [Alphaproteobacteria bacterium]